MDRNTQGVPDVIIVSGTLTLHPQRRDDLLESTREVPKAARNAKRCRCCVVAADPMEPDVAIVDEEWATEDDLLAFRGQGASPDMRRMIAGADVRRHHAARSEPA